MKTMQDYTCYCTAEQTRRAYKLGAPITIVKSRRTKETVIADDVIEFDDDTFTYILPPTTQQMIGWLREKGFWIYIKRYWQYNRFYACFEKQGLARIECTDDFEEPGQAELAAIDAALSYLEEGGTK